MGLQDTLSKVPTWGWAGGGVFLIFLVFLMTKPSGTQVQSAETPAPDINDILNQLQDAANQLGDKPTTTPTPTTPTPTTTVKKLIGYVGVIGSGNKVRLYDKNRKFYKNISGVTLQFDQRVKIGGAWWYRIKSGKYKGMFVQPGRFIKITPTYQTTTTTPTTTNTQSNTVQNSNNQVAG